MRKMVSLRLTSLILAIFLILHALRNSLAHAHQAKVANDALPRSRIHVFARKELVDGNLHVAKAKMATMVGRKMIINHEVQQEDDHRVSENRTPVSGAPKVNDSSDFEVKGDLDIHYKVNDHTTSGYSSTKLNEAFSTTDYHGNDQGQRNALKTISSMGSHDESQNQVENKAFGNSKPPSNNSNKVKNTQDYESRAIIDDESKRYQEAAKEMMKLLHRDYGRWQKPKRRPPINNHSPKH